MDVPVDKDLDIPGCNRSLCVYGFMGILGRNSWCFEWCATKTRGIRIRKSKKAATVGNVRISDDISARQVSRCGHLTLFTVSVRHRSHHSSDTLLLPHFFFFYSEP